VLGGEERNTNHLWRIQMAQTGRRGGGCCGRENEGRAACGTARLGGRCGVKRAGSKILTSRVALVRKFASPRILSCLVFALHFIISWWLLVGPLSCWLRLSILELQLHGCEHSLCDSFTKTRKNWTKHCKLIKNSQVLKTINPPS
jgi:hypothetical protein